MPNRKAISAKQIRAVRIVLTQAGPGAHGTPRVMLDTSFEDLAMNALYAGGVKDFDYEDSDTGSYVRIAVSVRPVKTRRSRNLT